MLTPRVPQINPMVLNVGSSSSLSFSQVMGRLDIMNTGPATVIFALTSTIQSSMPTSGQIKLEMGQSWNKENIAYDKIAVISIVTAAEVNSEIQIVSVQNSGDSSD